MEHLHVSEATAALMAGITRRVEEFLSDLEKSEPNGLDALELENATIEIVRELGLGLMKEVFRHADETAPEVVAKGARWGNRQVSVGTFTVKYGTFRLERSGYQQAGRGRVMFPVELRLGLIEGRYSPAMARVMARTIAEMPAEHGQTFLEEVGLGVVSSSTLHRLPQDMSAVYERNRARVDAVVRGEGRVPEGTHTVQVGMDGVMVPMDGEHAKPRGRRASSPAAPRHERHHGATGKGPADTDDAPGLAYHEASVGTLAFFDAELNHLGTTYVARMPEYRKETLAADLEAELGAIVQERPDIRVALASDGAFTHWEHLEAMQARLPETIPCRQLLDFCHGAKYLFDAANAVESDDGAAQALATGWRSILRHRKDGSAVVLRALKYQRDQLHDGSAREELDRIVDYFSEHRRTGRLAYRQATDDGFPIGTGPTEAAAKTVVTVRMKRAGARYDSHGGQTILNFRTAVLSGRFDILMREVVNEYAAEVHAA